MAPTGDDRSIERALRAVARDIIQVPPGERLQGAVEHQELAGVGSGTVQKAFSIIGRTGAAVTEAHGHRGRFATWRDLGKLWSLASLPPVHVVLTPPGAAEIYGLVEGLSAELDRLGVPFRIQYQRGADARLARTGSALTLAVMSRGAAAANQSQSNQTGADQTSADQTGTDRSGSNAGIDIRAMPSGSYYSPDSVVVLRRADLDPGAEPGRVRVALDKASSDHLRLTETQFPEPGHRFVDCAFPQVPAEILRGTVDVGVWHRMLLLIPPTIVGLVEEPLAPATETLRDELGGAALAFSAAQPALRALVDAMSFTHVVREQQDLMQRTAADAALDNGWHR